MEDLPLCRIAAFVPVFAVKDLPLGRTYDNRIYYLIPLVKLKIAFMPLKNLSNI